MAARVVDGDGGVRAKKEKKFSKFDEELKDLQDKDKDKKEDDDGERKRGAGAEERYG